MNWWFVLYAVAGVPLTLWLLFEDKDYLTFNDCLLAALLGWLIGVPVFLLALVLFGNWPVIARDVWWVVRLPWTLLKATRAKKAPGESS